MKSLISISIAVFLVLSPLAQAAQTKAYYERESIWSPDYINVNGKAYGRHFFTGFSDLSEAMASNPEAQAFADRARRQMIWGSSFLSAGLVGAIGYAIGTASSNNFHDGAYWLIFFSGFIPGVFLLGAAEVNTQKAINSYNGVGHQKFSLMPKAMVLGPIASGAGTRLSWSF